MPIDVRNIESQVEIESNSTASSGEQEDNAVKAMQRWEELARQQYRRQKRTSAWGFDD